MLLGEERTNIALAATLIPRCNHACRVRSRHKADGLALPVPKVHANAVISRGASVRTCNLD